MAPPQRIHTPLHGAGEVSVTIGACSALGVGEGVSSLDLPGHAVPVTGGQGVVGVDFFISHAGRDLSWAEWVAWHLIDAGYTVELDSWDWAPGTVVPRSCVVEVK